MKLRDGRLFFWRGDGKFLKELFAKTKKCKYIVCAHRDEEKNSLQVNAIMQHQPSFIIKTTMNRALADIHRVKQNVNFSINTI